MPSSLCFQAALHTATIPFIGPLAAATLRCRCRKSVDEAVKRAASEFGSVDVMVANAGGPLPAYPAQPGGRGLVA